MKTTRSISTLTVALAVQLSVHAADTYTIDPAHTRVGFSVRHLGISNVKGKFNYGINYNQVLATGVAAVGEEVVLEINAEAVKNNGGTNAPAK